MKSASAVTAFILLAAPVLIAAQDRGLKRPPAEISEAYTVRPGDTLWDISGLYFGDPFSWPDLWKRNEFIQNPHRIYPGQVLRLGAEPVAPPAPPVAAPPETPRMEPLPATPSEPVQVVSTARVPEAVAPDRGDVIRALRDPRPVFTPKSIMRTGFITKRSELSRNRIVRIEGDQVGAIRYDTVVVDRGTAAGIRPGDLLAVGAVGDRVKHPETGVDYGIVVRIKGVLKVISAEEDRARCTVTETFDPLAVDDMVMPYSLSGGPIFDAWVKPDAAIGGVILAVNEPMLSVHTNDILYIDKGERDGVRPGDVFSVFRGGKTAGDGNGKPIGTLEAVNVMPGETAVIVSTLAGDTMGIGDRVELSARCRLVER